MDTNLTMWSGLVGFFLPAAIALIMRKNWGDTPRAIVGFTCCMVAAFGTCFFSGKLTGVSFVTTALTVLVTALATFMALWNKVGATDALEKITNSKTS